MPLAFESENLGTIAFGFFNIESDLLLLDRYFIFATDFCDTVCELSANAHSIENSSKISAYVIEDYSSVGDLHGAISATNHTGFIGETYKAFPFPKDLSNFKQQTNGYKNRAVFEEMLLKFASRIIIELDINNDNQQITIGPFIFSLANFSRLIDYVIKGGYPQWLNDIAPDYVLKMKMAISQSLTMGKGPND